VIEPEQLKTINFLSHHIDLRILLYSVELAKSIIIA